MLRITSLLSALVLFSSARSQTTADYDAAVQQYFTADAPGGAVLVAQGGKVLYERALGMADMSKTTALTTGNQFRVGSVTKQFAAVAIMQLAEQGKLALGDEIQKYVDFPKKEHPITIEHLLTHTSGIPSFTGMPSYKPEAYAKDVTLPELIALFADLPLEFAPGTSWNYSNSGYILITAIIERASGRTWPEYAAEYLFKPAGMQHSSAAITGGPLPHECIGYAKTDSGYEPARPISLTWPRGAGSIRSTVDDLLKWNSSVFAGKLVPSAMLAKAHAPYVFPDGSTKAYGYGWGFQNVQGSPSIEHNGGIDGFASASIYLPKEDIYVVALTNSEGQDVGRLAPELAAIALGKPYGGPLLPLADGAAQDYPGVYVTADSVERYITADEQGLHAQRKGGGMFDLQFRGNDHFMYAGDLITLTFLRAGGKVVGARFLSRDGVEQMLTRSDKPLPAPRAELALKNADLQAYVGEYEVMPGFTLTFRAEGDRFFVLPTRNSEAEVFGEAPHKFYLKIVEATIEFHPEADGTVNRLTYTQGETLKGVRIK